jgi:hypothetical protein
MANVISVVFASAMVILVFIIFKMALPSVSPLIPSGAMNWYVFFIFAVLCMAVYFVYKEVKK